MSGSTDLQIFVRGLDKTVDEAAIKDTFSKFGSVTKVTMPRHFETKEPRGFAFVTYENHSECVRASKEMNGHEFNGNPLLVELAKNSKDFYHSSGGFRGRDERDRWSTQRPFGRGPRGGGRGYSSGHRISRDFDDDRYRSEDYSNRRHPGAAAHHLVDGFRARRSPAPRNFGHREMRSAERDLASDWSDNQTGYGDERPLRVDRRDHYGDRRQHGNMSGRPSSPAPREHEPYSTRNGGRRSRTFHDAPCRYPPDEGVVRNRNRDNSERRAIGSSSPSAKRMRISEYSHEERRRYPVESKYLQDPVRNPVQVERNRADTMKRCLPSDSPQPKRIRMEKPGYNSHFSGRDASSFY